MALLLDFVVEKIGLDPGAGRAGGGNDDPGIGRDEGRAADEVPAGEEVWHGVAQKTVRETITVTLTIDPIQIVPVLFAKPALSLG